MGGRIVEGVTTVELVVVDEACDIDVVVVWSAESVLSLQPTTVKDNTDSNTEIWLELDAMTTSFLSVDAMSLSLELAKGVPRTWPC
jgi:hypothetical protein